MENTSTNVQLQDANGVYRTHSIDTVRNLMDDELATAALNEMTEQDEQLFVERYIALHFAKYGELFIVN